MDAKIKAIFDTVKATAAVVGDAAVSTAKSAGQKASDKVELAKLNRRLNELTSQSAGVLKLLGGAVYATHRGQDADEEQVNAYIAQLDEINAEIGSVKARISDYKNLTTCVVCGATCSKSDSFCKHCGTTLQ